MTLANVLPQKWKVIKMITNIAGITFNFASAVYFAKLFTVKGLNPTINKNDIS